MLLLLTDYSYCCQNKTAAPAWPLSDFSSQTAPIFGSNDSLFPWDIQLEASALPHG